MPLPCDDNALSSSLFRHFSGCGNCSSAGPCTVPLRSVSCRRSASRPARRRGPARPRVAVGAGHHRLLSNRAHDLWPWRTSAQHAAAAPRACSPRDASPRCQSSPRRVARIRTDSSTAPCAPPKPLAFTDLLSKDICRKIAIRALPCHFHRDRSSVTHSIRAHLCLPVVHMRRAHECVRKGVNADVCVRAAGETHAVLSYGRSAGGWRQILRHICKRAPVPHAICCTSSQLQGMLVGRGADAAWMLRATANGVLIVRPRLIIPCVFSLIALRIDSPISRRPRKARHNSGASAQFPRDTRYTMFRLNHDNHPPNYWDSITVFQ